MGAVCECRQRRLPWIVDSSGATLSKSGTLPDPQIWDTTRSTNSKFYRILWFKMWKKVYENKNPWQKRMWKSETHEILLTFMNNTLNHKRDVCEIWRENDLWKWCAAAINNPRKTTLLARTNGTHFQFLGFY